MSVRTRNTPRRRFAALGTLLAAVAALAVSAPGAPAATSCSSGEHFPEAKLVSR